MSSSWSIKRKYWWKFVSPYIHLHVYVWNPFSFDVIIAFLISILFSTNFFIYARMKVVSCWLINVIPECHFEIELICGGWAGEQLEWGIMGYLLTCRRMEWNGSSWLCCILNFIRRRNVWWRKVMMRCGVSLYVLIRFFPFQFCIIRFKPLIIFSHFIHFISVFAVWCINIWRRRTRSTLIKSSIKF